MRSTSIEPPDIFLCTNYWIHSKTKLEHVTKKVAKLKSSFAGQVIRHQDGTI